MTGEGVALPDEDIAVVASRFEELEEELRPSGISSRLLLHRFAYLSVRLERCERLDTGVYSKRVRHADEDFVDHRMTQVEALVGRLVYDPMTTSRRLQNTPEGIDWLVGHWGELREDLVNRERNLWTLNHCTRMERLLGNPEGSFRYTRPYTLTQALTGFFSHLDPSDGAGLSDLERMEWCRDELAKLIDIEVVRLQEVRASLDPRAIEQDRLEASDRCLFDLQPAMDRVRKYEAATERGMYKALKEFRVLESELKANRLANEGEKLASIEPVSEVEEEASEKAGPPAARTLPPLAQIPESIHFPAKRTLDEAPRSLGYPENRVS